MRRLPLLCGRLLLLVLASTLTLAAAPPGSQSSLHGAAPDRPNFVFVMADDQGWGDVDYNEATVDPGAGGESYTRNFPHTPNLRTLAQSPHAVVFSHFYSGSPVCSPTRSAFLTGRTPDRECIFGAEGCGQLPMMKCISPYPLPPPTFTLAEAAKLAGYNTTLIGKWHLGDFAPKDPKKPSYAQIKWPVSHPGIHGFDEWLATEASAASTTPNCGCNPAWVQSGCVTGMGKWSNASAFACTNYWGPAESPSASRCLHAKTSTLNCVANLTQKITGDDSEFIMDRFQDFLGRMTRSSTPFVALLWLHTNHVPHPALPEYYHAYRDTQGNWAGDYLGTITQMDAQVGRLRAMLAEFGVTNNTVLWYTADNGPHTETWAENRTSNQATGGLRQCKQSVFEGGIRVPGIVEWPAAIRANRVTTFPGFVGDILPTFLDIVGLSHPQPSWAADGISLASVLRSSGEMQSQERTAPFGFKLGSQVAWISGKYKLVKRPEKGQCAEFLPPFGQMTNRTGPFLFDLEADPTETHDLAATLPSVYAELVAEMSAFETSIKFSQRHESGCLPPEDDSPIG
eukprot:m.72016 g.72016  ORF g.72016 m.72016 type:complete len:569 (+) comp7975_c0_seq4:1186-2892(+)